MVKKSRFKRNGPWPSDDVGVDRGDTLELVLGDLNEQGNATSVYEGILVEVAGGIPGEEVKVEVTRRFPEHLAATVTHVMVGSSDRVEPPCRYYLDCTGCQFQHISYDRQLAIKHQGIVDELSQHTLMEGVIVKPTIPSPRLFGYRNHARFSIGRKANSSDVGFVNRTTRRFVRIDECLIMDEMINKTLALMQGHARGMTQTSIRVGTRTGSVLVQPKLDNPDIPIESGQRYFEEVMNDWRFRVASSSFFQVNIHQAETIVDLLRAGLRLSDSDVLVDAYCGVGVFASLLAPFVRQVIGIEEAKSAVSDATENAQGMDNVTFIQAKTEDGLDQINRRVDALILDPPRIGCSPNVIEMVNRLAPTRVAVVSCEPSALARDLIGLSKESYVIEYIQPIDMFPQTRHIEAVAILCRGT